MERLTERHNFEIRGLNGEKYNQTDVVLKATGQTAENYEIEKVYEKLCEFEDFMESFGFEELEQLEHELGYVHWNKIEKKSEFITHKYNSQKLKDRWNKLKEWIFNTKPLRGASVCFLKETLLGKMEELEKENKCK